MFQENFMHSNCKISFLSLCTVVDIRDEGGKRCDKVQVKFFLCTFVGVLSISPAFYSPSFSFWAKNHQDIRNYTARKKHVQYEHRLRDLT